MVLTERKMWNANCYLDSLLTEIYYKCREELPRNENTRLFSANSGIS